MSRCRRNDDQHPAREGAFGNARGARLSRVRPRGRARPALRVSGVLRPARDRLRLPGRHPRGDRGRARQHLALQGAAAGARRHRAEPQHGARLHPAAEGRQPRPRARHRQPVGQGRLDQPHQLLQGPRRRLRAERRPRARRQGLRLPVDRQPRQRGRRRRRPRRDQDRGLHPEQPRAAQAGQLGDLHRHAGRRRTATTTTSTSSPPRSPARRTAGRSSTSTSGRSTPRAPRRSATRSPSSSAGGCPTRSSSRSPPARS